MVVSVGPEDEFLMCLFIFVFDENNGLAVIAIQGKSDSIETGAGMFEGIEQVDFLLISQANIWEV